MQQMCPVASTVCSNKLSQSSIRLRVTLLPTSMFMIPDAANFAALDSRRSCSRGRGRFTGWTASQLQLTLAGKHVLKVPSGTAVQHTTAPQI